MNYIYSSGDEDYEAAQLYLELDEQSKEEHVKNLWRRTIAKARGAVQILNTFGDLNRRIYLHGSTRKNEYIEMKEKLKPFPLIIMPNSRFKNFWNIVMMVLLVYTGTYVPYKTAFLDTTSRFVFILELVLDSIFMLDLIINFLSAYEDKDKNVEFRLPYIAFNYIRSWFFLDVVACIPFQLLGDGEQAA